MFENLDHLRDELLNRHLMWKSLKEWRGLTSEWVQTKFIDINAEEIQKIAETYAKIASRLEKSLPPNAIQEELKDLVDKFKQAMPIVVALRNSNLQESHWQQIRDLINADIQIKENPDFSLQSLLDLNVVPFQEDICAISVRATGEAKLSRDIEEISASYKSIKIETRPYKEGNDNVFILDKVDEIYTALDESQANINQVLGNRFVTIHREQATKLKTQLSSLEKAMEKWIEMQKLWIYLENIMSGKEIKKELATEHGKFEQVDKQYKKTMVKVNKSQVWVKIVQTTSEDKFIKDLYNWVDILDGISK